MTKMQGAFLISVVLTGLGFCGVLLVKEKQDLTELEAKQVQAFYLEAKDVRLLKVIDSTSHVICYTTNRNAALSCVYLGSR